jgi:hypothetical protein
MTRKIGQVSFNLRDGYESRLYAHASKTEHGEFSKYIKRLIERDMSQLMPARPPQLITKMETEAEFDVTSFL